MPAYLVSPSRRWSPASSLVQSRSQRCPPSAPLAHRHCAGLPRPASLVRRPPAMVAFSPPAGLTPRSSGEPTACRLAREAVLVIIGLAGQSSHRRLPLSSNVRQRRARSSDSRCPVKQPVHGPAFPQLASGWGLCSSQSPTDAVIQVATVPASGSRALPALQFRPPTHGDPDRVAVHCHDLSLLQPFDAVHCVASQVVLSVCRAAGYCTKPSWCIPGGWNT
jgi:hypothetical protein